MNDKRVRIVVCSKYFVVFEGVRAKGWKCKGVMMITMVYGIEGCI